MLDALLIIVLLPIAIIVIGWLFVIAVVLWKLLVALLLWFIAGVMVLVNQGDATWQCFLTFIVGCGFFVSWIPVETKQVPEPTVVETSSPFGDD